jgi:hypothetical protein
VADETAGAHLAVDDAIDSMGAAAAESKQAE